MVRLVLAASSLALVLAAAAAGAKPPVVFPRDHFGHPRAGIEWWYFSALVRDGTRTPYSVFFTMFSSQGGLISVSQVVNLASGVVVVHNEGVGLGRPGSRALDLRAAGARLRYVAKANSWSFSVAAPTFAVSLSQHPLKPYTLHGNKGLIRQSAAGSSHYYSSTRMSATGTLRIGTTTTAIRGQSWFDHQWGNYREDHRAFNWDWFSCRFDDDTELMLYQFLDPTSHQPLDDYRSGSYVTRTGKTSHFTAFTAIAGSRIFTDSGQTWPLDWMLNLSAPALSETITSLLPDQLVRNSILPTFWEGVATATGTKHGTCFVEISYR
jgi:predicted secreted hydrolase